MSRIKIILSLAFLALGSAAVGFAHPAQVAAEDHWDYTCSGGKPMPCINNLTDTCLDPDCSESDG